MKMLRNKFRNWFPEKTASRKIGQSSPLARGHKQVGHAQQIKLFTLFQVLLATRDSLLERLVYSDAIALSQFHDKAKEVREIQFSTTGLRVLSYNPEKHASRAQGLTVYFDFETSQKPGRLHTPIPVLLRD